ncbi:hypothetical protein [uncultured Microbacterium sp.]|uniref:hypothetical protein n=1 Tax=uncultured Microbacterium sp. TaxID=191216 RepID=UPI00261739E2|nr:hypothetical protein [uncultured Microbacterium sp.]
MTRRKDPEIAAEWIRGAFGWIVILLAAILVVPVAIIAGIGFAQGTIPSSDAGGIFGSGPGYPAFPPPFWLLWIPALGALALSVATWRFRGQFMDSIFSARWDLAIVAIFGASTTLAASVTFGAPYLWVVLGAVAPWVLTLLVVLSRGVWDAFRDAATAFRPAPKADPRRPREAPSARESIPALRITADADRWKRSRQHLTLQDGDPRTLAVDVYDSATNDLGLARALVRAIDGEDAAPPRSTPFSGGPGTAIRTVRQVAGRGRGLVTATWHWDDGKRAILMATFDVDPDRFAAVEADLDRLAAGIRIGTA